MFLKTYLIVKTYSVFYIGIFEKNIRALIIIFIRKVNNVLNSAN